MAGIGGTRRDVFAPELGKPCLKKPIDHRCNTLTERLRGDKAAPYVQELFISQALITHGDPLQPRPGAQSIQREEEPILEGGPVKVFPRRGAAKEARKIDA